jgi:hypothetical protein
MKNAKLLSACVLALALGLSPAAHVNASVLALNASFVKKNKDRATLDTNLFVDHFHKSPNSIIKDGDIHIAGRDTVILLPLVVEMINGALMKAARERLKLTSPDRSIPVSGVWRLWFEHPGREPQIQGEPVPIPENSGPDHLFEIHPVTTFDGVDVLPSFVGIKSEKDDFRGKDARSAFTHYESRDAFVWPSNTAIMIETNRAFHNYTEFQMELTGRPKKVDDGYMVFAMVYAVDEDTDEPLVPRKVRMVFVEGTPAADAVKGKVKGDRLHVLGIPRVNLNTVYAYAMKLKERGVNDKEADLEAIDLPYEMIIAAVYEDTVEE